MARSVRQSLEIRAALYERIEMIAKKREVEVPMRIFTLHHQKMPAILRTKNMKGNVIFPDHIAELVAGSWPVAKIRKGKREQCERVSILPLPH